MRRAAITGTGSAVPSGVLSNQDLEKMVETSNAWILERTGIRERRRAAEGEGLSDYAVPAARKALEMAGLDPAELDLILCATVSPDMLLPSTASIIQAGLGARKSAAFDMQAACSGFIYASSVAQQFIETGAMRHVLVVGGELLTKFTDYTDRSTCILFGDGAGAAVYGAAPPDYGVLSSYIRNDGTMCDYLTIMGGGSRHPATHRSVDERLHYIRMKGNETFKIAIRSMTEASEKVMTEAGVSVRDVGMFIAHQANKRILDAVADRLGFPGEKTYCNIERMGNTSSASIPIALDELNRAGRLRKGDLVLLTAFGGGLTWGAILLRWMIEERRP